MEWVCTKTLFSNGSVHKGCEKRFTGRYQSLNFTNITCCAILKVEKHSAFVTEIKMTVWKKMNTILWNHRFPFQTALWNVCVPGLFVTPRALWLSSASTRTPGVFHILYFRCLFWIRIYISDEMQIKLEKYRAHGSWCMSQWNLYLLKNDIFKWKWCWKPVNPW